MGKLHRDMQASRPDFQALHLKDPCHLLNNALAEGVKLPWFKSAHDLVVHFPALLKGSRELRRKFNCVCQAMKLEHKYLATVSPSRWFSFYEALDDVLQYWRPIVAFLQSEEAVGEKCNRLKSLVATAESVHVLFTKLIFLQESSSMVMSVLKEMESEGTLVCDVYKILGVKLKVLLDQWSDLDHLNMSSKVECLMNVISCEDARQELLTCFASYTSTVSGKWKQTVERNLDDQMKFTEAGFWYSVQIVNPNVKRELPKDFALYENIYRLVVKDDVEVMQLPGEFDQYYEYHLALNVPPVEFWSSHLADWPLLARASLDILGFPVSSVNVERAFSMLRVVNRKERSRMTDENLCKYACLYYNRSGQ